MSGRDPKSVLAGLCFVGLGLYVGINPAAQIWTYGTNGDAVETTQGRVQELNYGEHVGDNQTLYWRIDVRYTYTVDGTTYEGTTLFQHGDDRIKTDRAFREFRSNYSENETITVYYDPSKPGESFLKPVSLGAFLSNVALQLLIVLVVVGIGVLGVWGGLESDPWYSS